MHPLLGPIAIPLTDRNMQGMQEHDESASLSDQDPGLRVLAVILGYSRFLLVAVYSHLLLLDSIGGQVFWRWLSVFAVCGIWSSEIFLDRDVSDRTSWLIVQADPFKSTGKRRRECRSWASHQDGLNFLLQPSAMRICQQLSMTIPTCMARHHWHHRFATDRPRPEQQLPNLALAQHRQRP